MPKNVFFSIIVPVFNTELYLERCIESIICQKYSDFELIIVDDGSSDSSPEICDLLAAKYDRIRVIHTPNNGPSDARNIGFTASIGDYITFTDSDDFWSGLDVLSNLNKLIKENSYPDIILSDIIKYYTEGDISIIPKKRCSEALNKCGKQDILEYLYFNHADLKMSACQKIVKRKFLDEHKFVSGMYSEDIEWSMRLYPAVRSISLSSNPYYCYRQLRPGSRSTTPPVESFNSTLFIIEKYAKEISTLNISSKEASIYYGYLAYQLSMAVNLYNILPDELRGDAIRKLKSYKYLLSFPTNYKTIKIKLLIKLLGFKGAAFAINKFISYRAKWHRKQIN